MTFLHPTFLIALAAVGAAALLALLRPGRQMIVVASLAMWRQTLNSPDAAHLPRSRRLTLHWLLLLAGAVAAVLAAGQPVFYSVAPARAVALVLYPSAEVAAPAGMDALRRAASELLARLDEGDRVAIIAPGAAGRWGSVSQARDLVTKLPPWPLDAAEMTLPAPPDARQVYRIAPAGAVKAAGPGETVIEIPASLPDVTFDALAATVDGNDVRLFVALRNNTDRVQHRQVSQRSRAAGRIEIPPHQRREITWTCPADEPVLDILLKDAQGAAGAERPGTPQHAFLAARAVHRARVAMVGADERFIRQFINISRELILTSDANDADVLVCSGANPPAERAAMVIQPPWPPPDMSPGATMHDVALGELTLHAAGEPDGDGLAWPDLKATAVHLLPTWSGQGGLSTFGPRGGAFFAADARSPRRVYIAFSLAGENTNFGMTPDFVKFLADAFTFLVPHAGQANAYEWRRPGQVAAAGLKPIERDTEFASGVDAPHPWPGLYADEANRPVAVNIVGLRAAAPAQEPAKAIETICLPPRVPQGGAMEFWPVLAAAAMLLWLAGWLLRVR